MCRRKIERGGSLSLLSAATASLLSEFKSGEKQNTHKREEQPMV